MAVALVCVEGWWGQTYVSHQQSTNNEQAGKKLIKSVTRAELIEKEKEKHTYNDDDDDDERTNEEHKRTKEEKGGGEDCGAVSSKRTIEEKIMAERWVRETHSKEARGGGSLLLIGVNLFVLCEYERARVSLFSFSLQTTPAAPNLSE